MRKKTMFLFLLTAASMFCWAEQKLDSTNINLPDVQIKGSRQRLYSSQLRAIQSIDRKTIEKLPVANLDELLETIAGVDIRNRGIGGTQADISIRGGSFDQVLVLLNGVNISDPQTGHYNLDIPIELSDVQRVEVLRGSAARVYGVNAFSGAINIITSQTEENSISLKTTAGSFNTFTENVSANLSINDGINVFASLNHKSSDGYIENTDFDIKNMFFQLYNGNNARNNFNIQLAYQQKNYGANGFYSLAYPNQFDHTQTFYGALNWNLQINNKWTLSAQLYGREHYDRFELFRDKENAPAWYSDHNYHITRVVAAKIKASFSDNFGILTFGIDPRLESIQSTVLGKAIADSILNPYDKQIKFAYSDQRFLPMAFVDYKLDLGSFHLSAGASLTYSEQFGNSPSYGGDIAYQINESLRIFTSGNTALRFPTFTDLYYKSTTQKANPNLKPEKSNTIELGIQYSQASLTTQASVFYRSGKDIIDWVKTPHPDSLVWYSRNLTEVNALGAELSAKYVFKQSFVENISLDYSFLNLDKSADSFDSKYALDYLKHKLTFAVQHRILTADNLPDDYNLSLQWKAAYNDRAGNYSDFKSGEQRSYDPFFLADVRILFESRKLAINFDVNNLSNSKYIDFGGLRLPGINVMAGIRLKLR